jgi:DNA-binding transcriptional ArsR family regulator
VSGVDRTLAALADPARRGAVDLLRVRQRRAGELAGALGLSAPAMSRHLRVLKETGLVEEAHGAEAADARVRVYRLKPEPFDALRAWVADVESFWTLELAAFKRHAERAGQRKKKKR